MYLSNFAEIGILGTLRGVAFTAPGTMYITMSGTEPAEDGSGIFEPTYPGYTRKPFVATVPAPMAGISGSIGFANQDEIKFAQASADSGTMLYIVLMDSLGGGNMWAYARLETPKAITASYEPVVRAGEARFWFASANTTDEMKTRMLNLFRGVTMSAITPYASLANGQDELNGGNFARAPVTFTEPVLLATAAHEISNDSLVEFAIASATLGNYDIGCIYDAATGGSKLIAASVGTHFYAAGDRAVFDPGALRFSLN